MVLTHKGGSMLYASKTRTILVPVLHTERSKVDRVFVVVWRLIGGHFENARVGMDTAHWMKPMWATRDDKRKEKEWDEHMKSVRESKRRVRVTANM
jgi:endonuclease IV